MALSISGCGLETYERRLAETSAYYAYLDRLDQNLAGPWRTPPVVELRVPRQFKELPAPQPTTNPDGSVELPSVDPRQPDFISLSFKGLLGAWQAEVNVVGGTASETRPAYLYVASNYDMFLTDQISEAPNFTQDLLTLMEGVLLTPPKEEPAAVYPKGNQYFPRQTYDVAVFHPDLAIHDARYAFEVYAQRQADIQVVLILVRPEGVDPQAKLSERISMMLECLRVSGERPQPKQPGGAPTQPGAPAGGGF